MQYVLPKLFHSVFFLGGVVLEQNKADSARICRKAHYKSQSTLPWNLTYSHLKKSMLESRIYLWLHLFGGGAWRPGPREPDSAISAHPGRQWFQFPLRKTHWTFDRSTSVDLEAPRDGPKRGRKRMTPSPPKKGGKTKIQFWLFWEREFILPKLPPQHFTKEKSRMKVLCWNVAGFCWHQNLLIAYDLLFYVWWFLIDVS